MEHPPRGSGRMAERHSPSPAWFESPASAVRAWAVGEPEPRQARAEAVRVQPAPEWEERFWRSCPVVVSIYVSPWPIWKHLWRREREQGQFQPEAALLTNFQPVRVLS